MCSTLIEAASPSPIQWGWHRCVNAQGGRQHYVAVAEYQTTWLNPWLNIFLFVTQARKAGNRVLLKSCNFAEGCRAWKRIA